MYAWMTHLKYSRHVLKMYSLLNAGHSTGAAGMSSVESSRMTVYMANLLKKAAMSRNTKKFIQPAEQGHELWANQLT